MAKEQKFGVSRALPVLLSAECLLYIHHSYTKQHTDLHSARGGVFSSFQHSAAEMDQGMLRRQARLVPRGPGLMGKESSHVSVACWPLGYVKVLAARQNDTARASHKRHAVKPVSD